MKNDKKFWDKASKLYTPIQEKANLSLFQEIARISLPYTKDKDVLEIACGTGQITNHLATYAKSFIATDYSNKMINEAMKRNILKASFKVEDATDLSFKNQSMDAVIIANALHIMPEPDLAMNEIKRVLKQDGILIAPTFVFEGKVNKLRLYILKALGFKTYHKWRLEEYISYLEAFGFEVIYKGLIPANPLPDGMVILKKKKIDII